MGRVRLRTVLLLWLLWGGLESRPAVAAGGTERMAVRLQQWAAEYGDQNPYANLALIRSLEAARADQGDPDRWIQVELQLAWEYLNQGRPEASLAISTNLVTRGRRMRASVGAGFRRQVRQVEALAWLRMGELRNCLHHHNSESCIFPVQGGGRHVDPEGSRNALPLLESLAGRSNDLGSRWLVNLAAMTLDRHPGGVESGLLIPPAAYASEYPLPRFPEVAPAVGLAISGLAGASVTEDFDGDGLLDVFLTSWGLLDQSSYLRNLGNGQFTNLTTRAGLDGVTGGLNAMQADYDNDGDVDIYLTRGAWLGELGRVPDSLLRNNGDGTFEDVTEEMGLLSFHPALSAVWFDADNDGWVDLYVGNETVSGEHPHPSVLYLNEAGKRFREAPADCGAGIVGFIRGVSAGDFDNDGRADLYLSIWGAANRLLRNESGREGVRFRDVTLAAQVGEPRLSFPTWFWDYDNDGWLDLFVCGYGSDSSVFAAGGVGHGTFATAVASKLGEESAAETPRLFRNLGEGRFEDVSQGAGLDVAFLGMGANYGDLDNDGFLDFYIGTGTPYVGCLLPNEMMRNDRGRRFQDVTTAGGFGHLQKGHGISFADLNNDGQQDVFVNVGGAYSGDRYFAALFANPGSSNRWVTLKLTGSASNRSAIGARIKVVVKEGGEEREIHRVVGSGGSFGSSPLRQEIGLGLAGRIDRLEVWWPVTGKTNVHTGLEAGRFYELAEGGEEVRAGAVGRFAWPLPGG